MKSILVLITLFSLGATAAPEKFKIDTSHSAVLFKALHFGAGYTWGRFNKFSGDLVIDEKNPSNGSIRLVIDAKSVDSDNVDRDKHLRNPDFLNAKEFPKITFTSRTVKKKGSKYMVTGDLKLHGKSKEIQLDVDFVGRGDDPWGNHRIGMDLVQTIKMSDFGIKGSPGGVGDEIKMFISIEGMRKKKK